MMLSVQWCGYAIAGVAACVMLALGETVDATFFGICIAVVHFFVMIFMIRSMRNVRRLHGLRNGRIANLIFCPPDYDDATNTWGGGRMMGEYDPTPEQIVDWAWEPGSQDA